MGAEGLVLRAGGLKDDEAMTLSHQITKQRLVVPIGRERQSTLSS